MSVPKYKALLIACITLFLCGCGQALSEREIVRAVFFARQQGQYSVCLLLADQNNNEDGLHYKTSSARGFTAAQALHRAKIQGNEHGAPFSRCASCGSGRGGRSLRPTGPARRLPPAGCSRRQSQSRPQGGAWWR